MVDIGLNILASLAWTALGIVGMALLNWYRKKLPGRKLWQLKNPSRVVICLATSTTIETTVGGEATYARPATGTAQVQALGPIIQSLRRTYGDKQVHHIILSHDWRPEYCNDDLIVIGGANHNEVAIKLFEMVHDLQPAYMPPEGSAMFWRERRDGKWVTL